MAEPRDEAARVELWADVMRRLPSAGLGGFPLLKAELRAVLDALDDARAAGEGLPADLPISEQPLSGAWIDWLWEQVTDRPDQ